MSERAHLSPNQRAWRRFRSNRLASVGLLTFLVLCALVLLWPLGQLPRAAALLPRAMTRTPDTITEARFAPPSWEHWFGTDAHGRDVLSRVCHGTRISLMAGLVGAAVSLVIGVAWGAVAGYRGGRWDGVMMRIVDVLYSMPTVVFVIVLVTAINAKLEKWQSGPHGMSEESARLIRMAGLFAGLGAVSWLTMARIVRGQVLTLRRRPFIDASLALGASHARILWRHILPNVSGVVIVYLTLTIPSVMLYESFLSYLGLGIQPPQASLGSLMASGAEQINPIRIYWWLIVFPGAALALTLLALTFVGDGLRDAFDPGKDSGSA